MFSGVMLAAKFSYCLHSEELANLHAQLNIIRVIKSRRTRWVERVGSMVGNIWRKETTMKTED